MLPLRSGSVRSGERPGRPLGEAAGGFKMRAVLVLALAVAITTPAVAGTVDPADAWRPMGWYMGTWKGTRAGGDGPDKVTRVYSAASTNHHLEITEKAAGSRSAVRGMVSLDAGRGVLVLRQFAADGSASEAALASGSDGSDGLVFATTDSASPRTRITYTRSGANAFVERIERAAGGESFALVSETRFVRSD